MAKIDKIKRKLRYNKDLSYQMTGKDLKILIDYINDIEENITTTIAESLLITQTITLSSDDFLLIDITGIDLTPLIDATVFLPLGANIFCAAGGFSPGGTLNIVSSFGTKDVHLMEFADTWLSVGSNYPATIKIINRTSSLALASDAGTSVPGSPEVVTLELTYLKIA